MKRTKLLMGMLLALILVFALALGACGDDPSTPDTPDTPNTPDTPTPGPSDDPSDTLKVTVTPAQMEIFAGEEIDLLFGVSVNDQDATLIISDDGDFDAATPGTYTITYQATKGDKTATATRTVTVKKALSALGLEVRKNYLGENKWQGNILSFAHELYVELSENTELAKQSGVFHNTSDGEIILTIDGTYGCSAILTANGVVIEGRDGANSRLVNADNPKRAASTVTTLTIDGESVSVSSAFAKELKIPAGGYAVVVQAGYAGTTADTDGRGFMNYNVIYEVGNVVRLYWVDENETLTPYVNQKPTVEGNTKILVKFGDTEFSLDTAVLAGLVIRDDNGTFALDDDTTIAADQVTIVDRGGFNVNEPGTYVVRLSVSDGTLTTEFTREVEVKSDGIGSLTIGDKVINIAADRIATDLDLTAVGNYAFIIYTPAYTGTVGYSNGYGVAIVVDEYGTIIRIYDGANAKYYDADNPNGVVDATKCTATGYIAEAFASRGAGETVIIAPNSTANNAAGGSRKFLLDNRTVGATVSGLGLTFTAKSATITVGDDKTFTADDGKWLYNTEVTVADVTKYLMLIYDKNYTGEISINGYGAAIVLDKYGVLIKIYDGANGGFYTVDGKSADPLTFTTSNYATVAFAELGEGETLIIFPNDGGVNGNAARAFALSLRGVNGAKAYCGETVTLTGKTFETKAE